jgi:hypothetical protein
VSAAGTDKARALGRCVGNDDGANAGVPDYRELRLRPERMMLASANRARI